METEIPNGFYRVSMKALILDESRTKFAVVLEDNGWWELPGGGLDFGETAAACIKRELKEEMGITTTMVSPSPSYYLVGRNMKGNWTLNLVFETEVENLDFTPSDECQEVRFVTNGELKSMNAFRTVKELGEQFDPLKHSQKSTT